MDDPERLTAEWLHLHGTPEQRAAYISMVERRNRMLDDHERRLAAFEVALVTVQNDIKEMSSEARTTRAEQNMMLKEIVGQVQTIVREQDRETGRRQGMDEASARADKVAAQRRSWAQALLPFLIASGLFASGVLGSRFVQDVVSETHAGDGSASGR